MMSSHRLDPRVFATLVSLLFLLVACAAVSMPAPAQNTLVVWVDTPAIAASIQSRVDAFTRDHPNLQVKVFNQAGRIKNGDISESIEALQNTDLAPDVVAMTNVDFRLMSNEGDLIDLGPYIIQSPDFDSSDFFPLVWESFRDRGKQYAIPSEVVPWMIYYNKSLLDQAKVDYPTSGWTTSNFASIGRRVAQSGSDKSQVVGFVVDPTAAFLPFVESFGVVPTDGAEDPYAKWLDDPRTANALQWLADLGLREKIMPTDSTNRALGFWFGGRAVMSGMFMDQRNQLPPYLQRQENSFLTPTVTAGTPAPPPGWKFAYGVAPVPRAEDQTTVYYVSGYGIPQASKDPNDAWVLIDYLSDNLPEHPNRAYVPARESLAYSKAFTELYPETGNEAYLQSVVTGHPLPAYPPSAQLNQDDINGVLAGTVHPSVALQSYRDRIQPMLLPSPTPAVTPVGES